MSGERTKFEEIAGERFTAPSVKIVDSGQQRMLHWTRQKKWWAGQSDAATQDKPWAQVGSRQVASRTDLGVKSRLVVWLTLATNRQQTRRRRYRELGELAVQRTKASACSEVRRAPGARESKSQRYLACEEQQRAG
jgi:hypothetical protein